MTCSIPWEVKYRSLKSLLTQIKLSSFWTDKTVRITSSTIRYLYLPSAYLLSNAIQNSVLMRKNKSIFEEKVLLYPGSTQPFEKSPSDLFTPAMHTASSLHWGWFWGVRPDSCETFRQASPFERQQRHHLVRDASHITDLLYFECEAKKLSPCKPQDADLKFRLAWARGETGLSLASPRVFYSSQPYMGYTYVRYILLCTYYMVSCMTHNSHV